MLKNLPIKDIYIGKSASWLSGLPGTKDPVPAPQDVQGELADLRSLCEDMAKSTGRDDFPVRLNEVTYRASVLMSLTDRVFVLRRMPDRVPAMEELSIHPAYVRMLTQPDLTGLIVVAGPFGQGKTTTASAVVTARLRKFGGVAVTIEDPPEMPLEGLHGEGVCYQTWVDKGEFGEACRKAARWAPSMILVGEIRDSDTAAVAIRASINGRLVICTVHADSVPMAIERIYTLAQGSIGNSEDSSSLLAGGLLCVLHQKLIGDVKQLKMEGLWLGDNESQGVRHMIRQRRFEQVGNEVQMQLNRLLMGSRQGSPPPEGERRAQPR